MSTSPATFPATTSLTPGKSQESRNLGNRSSTTWSQEPTRADSRFANPTLMRHQPTSVPSVDTPTTTQTRGHWRLMLDGRYHSLRSTYIIPQRGSMSIQSHGTASSQEESNDIEDISTSTSAPWIHRMTTVYSRIKTWRNGWQLSIANPGRTVSFVLTEPMQTVLV